MAALNSAPTIIGAGLAGLLAAHAWPRATVLESSSVPFAAHRAVLRFRGDAVSSLTGIDFRRVRVRKAIWSDGAEVPPSIRVANAYSLKTTGTLLSERSIWNIDPVDRFIAPEDFYERLVDAVGSRIAWGSNFNFGDQDRTAPVVSTAPMFAVLAALRIEPAVQMNRAPIFVTRFRVPRADVFQTVYFPDEDLHVYRASITGDLLIVESVNCPVLADDMDAVAEAMCLNHIDLQPSDSAGSTSQRFGKIEPWRDDAARKAMLFRLTNEHGIYSLGRFATWRNVLLDDVVHDITVIKSMLRGAAAYDVRKFSAK